MNIRPPKKSDPLTPLEPQKPEHSSPLHHLNDPEGPVRTVISTALLLATALGIAILLNTFVIQSYQVDGQSMESTLQNDDRLIVNKIPRSISRITGHQYVPARGDIIIFNQAGLPGYVGEKQLIKRVIGLPGDHVVFKSGETTVYNNAHPAGFDPDASGSYHVGTGQSCGDADAVLKNNEIFVMGDNRANSEDSRCFGPIATNQIVAKLVLRILPLNNAHVY